MKKIIFAVAFVCGALCSCNNETPANYGQFMDVEVYDNLRNKVYDMAMDIVTDRKAHHDLYCEEDDDSCAMCDYMCISEYNRVIIETYRVPDFWIVVHAVEEMDAKGSLADAFDGYFLSSYDEALKAYMKYSNQL